MILAPGSGITDVRRLVEGWDRQAAERRMRSYMPGLLPSGWSRLSAIVHRDDSTTVIAYSGYGLIVMVESNGPRHTVSVSRRGAVVTMDDLDYVKRVLYRRKLRGQWGSPQTPHDGLVKFVFTG